MRTVLIADDSNIFREPLAVSLQSAGYRVLKADNGRDAMGLMEEHLVDLCLLDVCMPNLDGIEMMREIRSDALLAETPVILITSLPESECLLQAEALGCAGYVGKGDFSLSRLTSTVQKVLADSDARRPTYSQRRQPAESRRVAPRPPTSYVA